MLIGRKIQRRGSAIAETFKRIYDLRCELVHGVRPKLAEEHGRRAFEAEALLRALVLKEINLLRALREGGRAK